MENTIVTMNRRTFRAALFGVVMLVFGGAALAATAPAVAPLKFEYTDVKGNKIENKITSGYEANVVAVDASGNVYVSDAVSNTVSVFNTNGRLIKQLNVNRATAVGVDKDGFKYINGSLNGGIGIFVFDGNDNGAGNLGTNWGQPGAINIFDAKSRDSSKGDKDYDVYVSDTVLNIVRRITLDADKSIIETKDYGPYIGERDAGEKWTYSISYPGYQNCTKIYISTNYSYARTRHRILLVPTVGVDAANGLMYVAAREITEYLSQTPASFYVSECTVKGETGCSGNDSNYMLDTEESWRNYNGSMAYVTTTFCDGKLKSTSQTVQAITTDSSYVYWNPVDPSKPSAAYKSYILVIDMNTGAILRKISSGLGDGSSGFHPRGLALDGNGRLYAAGTDVTSPSVGITVYDVTVNPETVLLSSSNDANNKFSPGNYMTIAYSPDTADSAKGRLFAAVADGRSVFSYGIDGGTNPLNTAPGKPILLEPANSAAVNTPTPTLKIKNATDPQNDPLTYGYEIKDSDGNVVASAAGIPGGSNNETIMTVTQGLADSSYHWRTQSFDGELAEWSDEATFCVDYVNTNPTDPVATAPVNNAPVSPFASSLSWTASNDYDCANDAVTYEVTVYDNLGNVLKSFSGVDSTSIKVSDISGLVRGNTYKWTVRAVDSRGGKSGYGEGSFVYKTSVVKFESSQPGTKVYIDGNYGYLGRSLGAASVEVQDITPGLHFVAFVKAGYEPLYKLADVVDPLVNDSAVTVSAKDVEWVTASRIRPSAAGTELARIDIGSSSPFIVDYNNDSLKDMVAGGRDGRVYLYLSEKQIIDGLEKVVLSVSGVLQAEGSDINAGSRAVPFVADYNNDGRKDLLVGTGDGFINLYLNTGTETAPKFTSAGAIKDGNGNDIKVGANSAPAVTDYNNDGKKDLVVGGDDGTLLLYINIGTDDSAPIFDSSYVTVMADGSAINAGSNSKPFFTDWNSDGTTDLLVGGGSSLRIYLNNGTSDSPNFAYSSDIRDLTGGTGDASPFVVDWDGTTARDIVVGNGLGSVVSYISACGGNVAGNPPPTAPVMREPAYGSYVTSATPLLQVDNASDAEGCPLTYGYEVADINGNIVANDSGIAEGSDGKTSMTVNSPLLENATYFWRVQAFDGDTVTGTTWSAPATFWVNAYNDNPGVPEAISPVNNDIATSFSTMLSWSQSTDPDINDTVSYYLEVSGDPSFGSGTAQMSLTGTSVRLDQVAISMVNNGNYYWRVKAIDNNGGESAYSVGSFTYKTTVVKFRSDRLGAKIYIDGNYGYTGRLLGSAPLEVEGISPGSHFVTFVEAGYEPVYKIVNVADPVDDDSALTVAARAEEWARASKVRPGASGVGLFRTSGNATPFVVDYNNDGLKDVIAGDTDGNVYLYLSEEQLQEDGSKKVVLVANGAILNINVGSRAVPFVVDYDNDGKKDLLVGSGDGDIYLYQNTGDDVSPVFALATTIKDNSGSDIKISNSAPNVVDYNNDGKKDLVVGGAGGALRLYVNTGTDASPAFDIPVMIKADNSDLNVGINSNSRVFFTDWNSDGKKDMVVGGNTLNLFFNVGADDEPVFVSIQGLQQWIKDKKRERGNREFIPYLGYNHDLDDLTGGSGEASPFVVDWSGTSARDVIVGNGSGGVSAYITGE